MSSDVKIWCLRVGKITVRKSELTYHIDWDKILDIPVFVYLIENKLNREEITLIDAGFKPTVIHSNVKGGIALIKRALRKLQVEESKIKRLILTHLHNDHAGFVDMFPNALVYIQEEEINFASQPIPTQRMYYSKDIVNRLKDVNIVQLNKDVEVTEGIKVIKTPGHTPGSQVVVVEANKKFIICGDTVPLYHNWFPRNKKYGSFCLMPRIPPGIHVDLMSWYDSCRKISMIRGSKVIIPGHEPMISDMRVYS